ncbi:MAG: hypothetical protein GY862_11280 [Gammaproteobacteria bacterium]|nr:hypothetical protein [Gammaproteobacteria bacterium]
MSSLSWHLHELLPLLARLGLEPSAEELADVLWLANYLPRPPVLPKEKEAEEPKPDTEDNNPPPAKTPEGKPPAPPRQHTDEAALYPKGDGFGAMPARPFHAPAVPMLPESLDLGRALRLLHQKVRSRTRYRLDEEATAERIAEQGVWEPVLIGKPERKLELAFIIDRGAAMKIWRPALDELRRLFSYNGAFRNVQTWELDTDNAQAELHAINSWRKCRPEELLRPDGRRLIVLATDCIGEAWHSGSVNTWLTQWQKVSPLAILHTLPQRLWPFTALGRGSETRFFSSAAGLPNLRLTPDSRDFWLELDENPRAMHVQLRESLKLPVITLEHETVSGWANLLRGKGDAWVSGFLFDAATAYASSSSPPAAPDANQIEKRLRQFRKASKPAKQLAAYLAAVPLNLSIMRLVQHAMLPDSRLTHLAEVLVSGLLREVSAQDGLPELVEYEFHPEVRPALLEWTPAADAVRVLLAVSEYIANHTGHCLDFMVLLADPEAGGDFRLEGDARYFATLGAGVLRRLGGTYQHLADKLEGKKDTKSVSETPLMKKSNPYLGLQAFQEADNDRFFGRSALTLQIFETLESLRVSRATPRFLTILGPSGSGKSSLAQAGLVPVLRVKWNALLLTLRPGTRPLENLAHALAKFDTQGTTVKETARRIRDYIELLHEGADGLRRIASSLLFVHHSQALVLLIDQFEEIFILCRESAERKAFITTLLTAAQSVHTNVCVVVTLRSDFLNETQIYPELNQLIAHQSIIVPIMGSEELRDAIERPAQATGYPLDASTVNLLLEQSVGHQGTLPLLQFALLQIWEGMAQGIPPAETLQRTNGIGGILVQTAEELYSTLSEYDKHIARRVFMKLVQLGEGSSDTRRCATFAEMVAHSKDGAAVRAVLQRFARADVRLITLSSFGEEIFIELTHEAILAHWTRLQEWLAVGREDLRFERRLNDAIRLWNENSQVPDFLWATPGMLSLLRNYYDRHQTEMTSAQIAFFKASERQQQGWFGRLKSMFGR